MDDPKEIWLQPWCDECERTGIHDSVGPSEGRQWCQDDVWGKCDAIDCDQKSVRYVLPRAK